ncbi:hypothetical protein HK405_012046, partial [Cladochytrium tenue]
WLGYTLFWLAAAHLVLTMISYALDLTPLAQLFFTVLYYPAPWGNSDYLFITGMISFIVLGFVVVTSLSVVRRNFYNFFFWTHMLVFVSIAFAYFHASMSIFYLIPGMAMYGVDIVHRMVSRCFLAKVLNVRHESGEFATFVVETKLAASAQPGNFMRVCLPGISSHEFHPLSIVRATPTSATFLVSAPRGRHSSEWAHKLVKAAAESKTGIVPTSLQQAALQGPFGTTLSLAKRNIGCNDAVVFFVGGSGIAPALASLHKLLGDPTLALGHDEKTSNVATEQPKRIFLFWSAAVCDESAGSAISVLAPWTTLAKSPVSPLRVQVFDTSTPGLETGTVSLQNDTDYTRGRPHLLALLNRHVLPLTQKASDVGEDLSVRVFVCGPSGFSDAALECAKVFKRQNHAVKLDVETESFAL